MGLSQVTLTVPAQEAAEQLFIKRAHELGLKQTDRGRYIYRRHDRKKKSFELVGLVNTRWGPHLLVRRTGSAKHYQLPPEQALFLNAKRATEGTSGWNPA